MAPAGRIGPSATVPEQVAPKRAHLGSAQTSARAEPPPGTSYGARNSGRTHIVSRGESLWSIAHGQIGGDATPAQIARLVNRLWELNQERIGTGDPDLLMVGTELRLP